MKCKYCGKEFNVIGKHINNCKCLPNEKTTDEVFIELFKYNYGEDFLEKVIEDYSINNLSLPDILKKYGLTYHYTQKIMSICGIPLRTIKESATKITSKKHRETCMKKYGVNNISQLESIKEKKKKTFIENYGVDNIWKTEEYKQFTRDRWNSYSDEEKTKILNMGKKRKGTISLFEKKIVSYLLELGVEIETQFKFKKYFHKYDIRIKNTNILIEINGDFWHANPNKYNAEDVLKFSSTNHIKAKDVWRKDQRNKIFAENKNYKVLYIWESDIADKNDIESKKFLLNLINEEKYE